MSNPFKILESKQFDEGWFRVLIDTEDPAYPEKQIAYILNKNYVGLLANAERMLDVLISISEEEDINNIRAKAKSILTDIIKTTEKAGVSNNKEEENE